MPPRASPGWSHLKNVQPKYVFTFQKFDQTNLADSWTHTAYYDLLCLTEDTIQKVGSLPGSNNS
jgi:hypothetical protein